MFKLRFSYQTPPLRYMFHLQRGWSKMSGEEEAHSTTECGVMAQNYLSFPLFVPVCLVTFISMNFL